MCNVLSTIRDDPQIKDLKPAVLKDFLEEVRSEPDPDDREGLAPDMYCQCGKCSLKPTLRESICCRSLETATGHLGKLLIIF